MVTPNGSHVISAAEAAELALITYRQLDHWARKEWVTPSVQSASGRGGRRLYSVDDVLRLAALRHFAKSGWQVNELGEQLAASELGTARWLVAGTECGLVAVADEGELHHLIVSEQRLSVYDLQPLRDQISKRDQPQPDLSTVPLRRMA